MCWLYSQISEQTKHQIDPKPNQIAPIIALSARSLTAAFTLGQVGHAGEAESEEGDEDELSLHQHLGRDHQ